MGDDQFKKSATHCSYLKILFWVKKQKYFIIQFIIRCTTSPEVIYSPECSRNIICVEYIFHSTQDDWSCIKLPKTYSKVQTLYIYIYVVYILRNINVDRFCIYDIEFMDFTNVQSITVFHNWLSIMSNTYTAYIYSTICQYCIIWDD